MSYGCKWNAQRAMIKECPYFESISDDGRSGYCNGVKSDKDTYPCFVTPPDTFAVPRESEAEYEKRMLDKIESTLT